MESRYEVIFNPEPSEVICTTCSLDEACSAIIHSPKRPSWEDVPEFERWRLWAGSPSASHRLDMPPLLVPDICTVATEWGIRMVPGEMVPAFVLLRDGHPIMLPDEEVKAHARAWDEKHMVSWWQRHSNGMRPGAFRYYRKGNAHHRTMRLDDRHDEEVPPLRIGARVPDAWDVRDCGHKTSKSWKDQSKRRHQWKPIVADDYGQVPPCDDEEPRE